MNKQAALAIAIGSVIGLPQGARAADLVATYSGFITAENASDTIFGGHAAIGDGITASFFYSTSVPGIRATMPGVSDEISGGVGFGTDSVISKAVFTSGGYSFSFVPDYYADVYTSPSFLDAYAYDTSGNGSQTYIVPTSLAPTDLEAPFSSSGVGDTGGPTTQYSFVSDGRSTIDFNATRIAVSAAPEPDLWSLMITGIGGSGLMLRGRRRRTLARSAIV